jgi:hypothetical protein
VHGGSQDDDPGSVGYYYDQNHWNFTDIYINETLLALRRVSLNANSRRPTCSGRRRTPRSGSR